MSADGVTSCSRKSAYATEAQAMRAADRLNEFTSRGVTSYYKCKRPGSNHWHVGHPTQRDIDDALRWDLRALVEALRIETATSDPGAPEAQAAATPRW